jgi:hypothetical protein
MVSRSDVSATLADHPDRGARPAVSLRTRYRTVFIIDGRAGFAAVAADYDPAADLVLTYDFGLRRDIERRGGDVAFLDQLVDADTLQSDNLRLYRFFERWHLDAEGADIFTHAGVPFGFSFRLEFWNDFIFHARTRLSLERLAAIEYDALKVRTRRGEVESILDAMGLAFTAVPPTGIDVKTQEYFFAIHDWMEANIRRRGAKARVLDLLAETMARVMVAVDAMTGMRQRKPAVFVQEYHPTASVIARLRTDGRVRVIRAAPTRGRLFGRYIALPRRSARHDRAAADLMSAFRTRRCERLSLSSGTDISAAIYRVIESRIAPRVAESIRVIEGASSHVARDPFGLVVLISNIGEIVTVVDCVCRTRGIPSFLIINGMLAAAYGDESKHATMINAYSPSIRDHYFRGMDNVVCLGDPRMDAYPAAPRRRHDPQRFTVTIGASGFNPTDLNSYVAVEFDFIDGVLQALRAVRDRGAEIRVVIKVRANGSKAQYVQFVDEYFPGLVAEVVDDVPMRAVLHETDLFISIYSQTLFEASCMGIPVIYYRVGDVFKYPPFDGRAELVTVDTVEALAGAIEDFRSGSSRFSPFLDRDVMATYIGPLDGRNLERNVQFSYDVLDARHASMPT